VATPESGQLVKGGVRLLDGVTVEAVSELVPGVTQPAIFKAARLGDIKELVGRGQSLKQKAK